MRLFPFGASLMLRRQALFLVGMVGAVWPANPVIAQPKAEIRRPVPLNAVEAEKEGRALVTDLLLQRPGEDYSHSGVLTIRGPDRPSEQIPIRFSVFSTPTNWVSAFHAVSKPSCPITNLTVFHSGTEATRYSLGASESAGRGLSGAELMTPFAGSDFWVADLGLEFFHWPKQLLLKKDEMRRGQACRVLESINPEPSAGGYSRVVSWIDIDSGGIVLAEAYDAASKLLKEFAPKEFKKVNGQWQLEGMEIRNLQTGSRTRIVFDVGGKK